MSFRRWWGLVIHVDMQDEPQPEEATIRPAGALEERGGQVAGVGGAGKGLASTKEPGNQAARGCCCCPLPLAWP